MNDIVINKVNYRLPHAVELNFGQLKALLESADVRSENGSASSSADRAVDILSRVCGVEEKAARRVRQKEAVRFADAYRRHIMSEITLLCSTRSPLRIMPGDCFLWRGEKLMFPASPSDFDGNPMPMGLLTAEEFCDAFDLYSENTPGYWPLITALLCRKRGEKQDPERAKWRAGAMEEVRLENILRLLAEMSRGWEYIRQRFPYCCRRNRAQEPGRNSGAGETVQVTWNDMLWEAAQYCPSEMKLLAQGKAYDFLAMLNSRNKLRNIR